MSLLFILNGDDKLTDSSFPFVADKSSNENQCMHLPEGAQPTQMSINVNGSVGDVEFVLPSREE